MGYLYTKAMTYSGDRQVHNIPRSGGDSENVGKVIQTQQIGREGRENLDTASTFLYTKPDV